MVPQTDNNDAHGNRVAYRPVSFIFVFAFTFSFQFLLL